jgi:Protein of unknown function (DUF2752)
MALALRESLADTTRVDVKALRTFGAGMLAVAAVRPLLPVEVVPPCPLRTLTGVPCPLCGMTRGVTAAVHGQIGHALFLNPGSVAAVILAIVALFAWRTQRVTVRVWMIVAVLGLLWSWQLFKYATGRPL